MKWLRIIVGGVLVMAAVIYGFGSAMPPTHVAAVSVQLAAPPEQVYAVISDVASAAAWRRGLDSVRIHPDKPILTWTEYHGSFGTLTFMLERTVPPSLWVARIADESQGFGGAWTYELERDGDGTRLTITERGIVESALFRFASRYVIGHHRTMEDYVRDLGARLSEDVTPRRIERE